MAEEAEKEQVSVELPPAAEEKPDDSKALAVVESKTSASPRWYLKLPHVRGKGIKRQWTVQVLEALALNIFFLHFAEPASQETKSVGNSIDRGDEVESFSCLSYIQYYYLWNDDKKLFAIASVDVALAQVETEKKLSLIKAWEESEKTKAENK
ncbi:hypothetical protein B296_00010689 [Ensete ventricosum]|uniref:Remorin N-terminal domain-containing protein n=1 Tax=Ensete ventricosum TaxID=4639 RepID=A0A427AHQ4_ENSVE|nr:hypothetical protein B296_00010689 [Ensete ventricosum]